MQINNRNFTHLKPIYHLNTGKNWLNDPNGPIFWNGKYHMFFQYNPEDSIWGNIHWGHAISTDMVRWQILNPVLNPGPEIYDSEGVFSGSSILHEKKLHLFYTASAPQTQCLAYETPGSNGGDFQKYSKNPIIPSPPQGYDTSDFRDPFIWKEEDEFRMIVASGLEGNGLVFLYKSSNLHSWQYVGEFYKDELPKGVSAFECPIFFKIDGRDVLVISPFDTPFYLTGTVINEKFIPERRGILDPNPNWYAPNTFMTYDGRRILIAWIREEWPVAFQEEAGWSGALSIPREVFTLPSGNLGVKPISEIDSLRDSCITIKPVVIRKGTELKLPEIPSAGEIQLTVLSQNETNTFEIALFEDTINESLFSIYIENNSIALVNKYKYPESNICPVQKKGEFEDNSGEYHIRIFLDCSIIEVFVNGHFGISTRVYPPKTVNNLAYIRTQKGEINLIDCNIYKYKQNVITH